jgi:hypothetical protein
MRIAGVTALLLAVVALACAHRVDASAETPSARTGDPPIVITRADIPQDEPSSVPAAREVRSQSLLVGYATELMRGREEIESIRLGSDHVSMTYVARLNVPFARLRTVERTLTMDADGKATLAQPGFASYLGLGVDEDALQKGFAGIAIKTDRTGMLPETQALILLRMTGRLALAAI